MDAFFVEVERLADPSLVGRPVAVGGAGDRGVVASASYEARVHGVHSAMPMTFARRRCPDLRIVAPDHRRYAEVSEQVFEIFRSFTPIVEGLSVDEAFLDVSGLRLLYSDTDAIAADIRAQIRATLSLPASVGIAATKFIAKMASGRAKPDGVLRVPSGTETAFLHPLPVGELWGVGAATYASLAQLGVATIGDLASIPVASLVARLGDAMGHHLAGLSRGEDRRSVEPDTKAKSLSVEHTYEVDITGYDVLETEMLRHSDRLSGRLRRAGVSGRTVHIKVRFSDFSTVTRSMTLAGGTDVARDIYRAARELLTRLDVGSRPVRLLGVGVSGLDEGTGVRQLAVDRPAKWDELADAVADVRARYGADSVAPARVRGGGAAMEPASSRSEFASDVGASEGDENVPEEHRPSPDGNS
jgi:DNA polymerase-4